MSEDQPRKILRRLPPAPKPQEQPSRRDWRKGSAPDGRPGGEPRGKSDGRPGGQPGAKPGPRSAPKPGGSGGSSPRATGSGSRDGGGGFRGDAQAGRGRTGEGRPAAGRPDSRPDSRSGARSEPRDDTRPGGKPVAPRPAAHRPTAPADPAAGVRVSKLLAERGLCSRREADAYIERGLVFVDGVRITELGTRARPDAQVTLAAEAKRNQARQATILLNKPVGFVSGQPEPGYEPAVVLIRRENQWLEAGDPEFDPRHLKGLAPAGRLDIDSTGLLVLTQDGRIARQLIGEDSGIEKEYLVRVEGELIAGGLDLLRHGLALDGKPLKPARVDWQNDDQLRFILREGKKRQIRRMCEMVGLKVVGLKRVRMGQVRLGDLPAGRWRYLREGEGF